MSVYNTGSSSPNFGRIIDGMIRATRLDTAFYNMVEKDTSYTQDSLIVVILASVATAIGSFIFSLITGQGIVVGVVQIVLQIVLGIGGFYLWVFLAQWVGTSFFKGQGDFGECQRCLGFAYAPRVLGIFNAIPCIGSLAALIGGLWSIVTGYFALREALDQDNTNAILTAVVSGIIVIVITSIISGVVIGAIAVSSGALGRP